MSNFDSVKEAWRLLKESLEDNYYLSIKEEQLIKELDQFYGDHQMTTDIECHLKECRYNFAQICKARRIVVKCIAGIFYQPICVTFEEKL